MEVNSKGIVDYSNRWSEDQTALLEKVERTTHLQTLSPGMLGGQMLGNFISFVCAISGAKSILEIGTFTGYSSLVFAQAIPAEGIIHTIESNEEVYLLAKQFFSESADGGKITAHLGQAEEIIQALDVTFDLVFIDASKNQYSEYYDLVFDKLAPGGIILADNVLLYGRVLESKRKPKAQSLHEFNQKVKSDKRVQNILLPFGDGVNCILKL